MRRDVISTLASIQNPLVIYYSFQQDRVATVVDSWWYNGEGQQPCAGWEAKDEQEVEHSDEGQLGDLSLPPAPGEDLPSSGDQGPV